MEPILIVDEDPEFRKLLTTILSGDGCAVDSASTVKEAVGLGGSKSFHLVLSGTRFPDGSGIDVLRWCNENLPDAPVVLIDGPGTAPLDTSKMRPAEYVRKPLGNAEEWRAVVRKALDRARAEQERELLRDSDSRRFNCNELIARDPQMLEVLELTRKVAAGDGTVLISGESGAGKQLLARSIHFNGARSSYAFVVQNCAPMAPGVVENELFGHDKGAMSSAVAQRPGRLDRAHLGTLFLDEVTDLDAALQARLLRFLQERTFERAGGTRRIMVDVRVIASTSRNIKQMVSEGRFREDLYYRLNSVPLSLPPLRQRRADIPALARHFLAEAACNLHKPEISLSPAAEGALQLYDWPGNVGELENVMERVAMLYEGVVDARNLPLGAPPATGPLLWKDIERQAIMDALRANNGNRTRAARQLGISLRTLQYRLKEWAQ
jgi:DNA-binding NtrC family response regulator